MGRVKNELLPMEPEEGDNCRHSGCGGHYELPPVEGCTCFRSAPCSACLNNGFRCGLCGDVGDD